MTGEPADDVASSRPKRPARRTVLRAALIGVPTAAVTAAAAGGGVAAWAWNSADLDTAGQIRFVNRLIVPPLAPRRRDHAGRQVYDLRAAPARRQFLTGRPTATWGINGDYLAPTLRATRGDTVLVYVRNLLPEATSLHWHGVHLPAAMDGGPHQLIQPGEVWSPTWMVDQPAATLWYHPHPHQRTARHVYRGLAGMFIIDDPQSSAGGLPTRYGVDDIPIIVQDKRFDADNQLAEAPSVFSPVGLLGDTVCVNGTLAPYLDVVTERVRLRLLNASNARVYRFGISDGRPVTLVGTDGGLLEMPYHTTHIQLSPGERAEIIVTVRAGERLVLRSYPPRLGTGGWVARFAGGADTLDIVELRAAGRLEPAPAVPSKLTEPPSMDIPAAVVTRTIELADSGINGQPLDMDRIDFAATTDSTEVWTVVNATGIPHNFHVHDVRFRVLSVDGSPPPPDLRGWKDTIYTPPGVRIRIAMRIANYPDPRTPYMYHCHLLQHEDHGLMGQFVVVEPGQHLSGQTHGHHS